MERVATICPEKVSVRSSGVNAVREKVLRMGIVRVWVSLLVAEVPGGIA